MKNNGRSNEDRDGHQAYRKSSTSWPAHPNGMRMLFLFSMARTSRSYAGPPMAVRTRQKCSVAISHLATALNLIGASIHSFRICQGRVKYG